MRAPHSAAAEVDARSLAGLRAGRNVVLAAATGRRHVEEDRYCDNNNCGYDECNSGTHTAPPSTQEGRVDEDGSSGLDPNPGVRRHAAPDHEAILATHQRL
jgi:hypothetical protein